MRAPLASSVVVLAFLASVAAPWFAPSSSVGIGDWDHFCAHAWVCGRALLERGWFPEWSVQLAGGAPLAGDPQSLAFSPLLALPLLFGPIVGIKLLVVSSIAAGLVGCYRLGLRWIGDPLGAALFAFVFSFSGYFAIHLRAGHLPWVAFLLFPWMLLFADRLLFGALPDPAAALGLVSTSFLFFGGMVYHPLVYLVLPLAAAYAVVDGHRAPRARVLLVLALLGCAALLTLPRWTAVIDWEWHSPRNVSGRGGTPLGAMVAMLLAPIADYGIRPSWAGSGVWEYWAYTGATATALGLLQWIGGRHRARTLGVAALTIGLALTWRGPFGNALAWLAPHVPVLSSVRVYSRFIGLVVFGVALLAGCTLAELRAADPRRAWLPFALFLAIVVDYGIVVRPIWTKVFELDRSTVYPSWDSPPEVPLYSAIRTAPPFQPFGEGREMFNSRMLPSLMSGAVVRNAYVAPALSPLALEDGPVVVGPPSTTFRITNHALDIEGDLRPGDEVLVHLRLPRRLWQIVERGDARGEGTARGLRIVVLRPCRHLGLRYHGRFAAGAWIACLAGLALTIAILRRELALARAAG